MTLRRQDLAAGKQREPNRDRESRRLSSAIDARRRLNTQRSRGTPINADPHGPREPRHEYLTRSYDEHGLPMPHFE
jgi:hypothetical protein